MNPYPEETYPENVKYILDTPFNRSELIKLYGESRLGNILEHTYIEIDMTEKTWRPTFAFQWLYRNSPPLTTLVEIYYSEKLPYEKWYDLNEERIYIELSENGADREMDFNPEKEFEKRYETYLSTIQPFPR
jgi:hypothetical protein